MKEADLTRKIRKALEEEFPGSYWIKIHQSAYSAGIPDILGCVEGQFFAFEVKRPDTNYGVTERQQAHLDRINRAEGQAAVITSVDEAIENVRKAIPRLYGPGLPGDDLRQ